MYISSDSSICLTYRSKDGSYAGLYLAVKTHCLVVKHLDPLVHFALHQWFHDCTFKCSKELASVVLIFRGNYEAIVIQQVTVQWLALTGFGFLAAWVPSGVGGALRRGELRWWGFSWYRLQLTSRQPTLE